MAKPPLVLLASARKQSDTRKFVNRIFREKNIVLLDLLDYEVNCYNYKGDYPDTDDFLKVVDLMLQHEQIIFATPVYWYAMSGLLKTFFDRLTDIVTIQKQRGRRMAGKETFLLAVGADESLPQGFEEPFKLTSKYFDMQYKACIYTRTKALNDPQHRFDAFLGLLNFD